VSDPYIGEIRMFGGSFAPAGWMLCQGQQLAIAENDALFTLIGTTYGGDGQSTFNLPNLQSRVPIHMGTSPVSGTSYQLGEAAGVESVTLTINQIPVHSHNAMGSSGNASDPNPNGNVLASSTVVQPYAVESVAANFVQTCITPFGGSQPHTNIQPYLTINFIISLFGIYPTQT
jgi:microcystin-dependent protein